MDDRYGRRFTTTTLMFVLACLGPTLRAVAADAAAGRVVDAAGRPVAEALVRYAVGWSRSATRADAEGRFTVPISSEKVCCVLASTADGGAQAFTYDVNRPRDVDHPLLLTVRPSRPIAARVVDGTGRPIAGAWVGSAVGLLACEATTDQAGAATVRVPAGTDDASGVVVAEKAGVGIDCAASVAGSTAPVRLTLAGATSVTVRAVDDHGQPMAGVAFEPRSVGRPNWPNNFDLIAYGEHFRAVAGPDGAATFNWYPRDAVGPTEFEAIRPGFCAVGLCSYDSAEPKRPAVATMVPLVHVAGRVTDREGNGVAGARVRIAGEGLDAWGEIRKTLTSDAAGQFAADVNPNEYDVFVADIDRQVSPVVRRVIRDGPPAQPIELKLQPATRVHGRLTGGDARVPLAGIVVTLDYVDRGYADLPAAGRLSTAASARQPRPGFSSWVKTGPDGQYEFWAGEERYALRSQVPGVRPSPMATVSIDETADVAVDLHSDNMPSVEAEPRKVHGRVMDHGAAVGGATIDMDGPLTRATSDATGGFDCYGGAEDLHIRARSADGTRVGLGVVHPGDASATVELDGVATASGRLLGVDRQPLARARLMYGVQIESKSVGRMGVKRSILPEIVVAGDDGRFTLKGLIAGQTYILLLRPGDNGGPSGVVGTARADMPGQAVDLGDLRLRSSTQGGRRPPRTASRPAR